MSKMQKIDHKDHLEKIKQNEFNTRYWKSQNDMMEEVLRNEELLPRYHAHLEKVTQEIKEAEAKVPVVINENPENPKIILSADNT